MQDGIAKAIVGLVALVAVVRVATSSLPEQGKPLDDAGARAAYRDIIGRERTMRREAAVKFPGDLWSQDDDFHQRESDAIRSFASSRSVRTSDVLRAVDDGMREHWPASVQPVATVPPCRPRLSY